MKLLHTLESVVKGLRKTINSIYIQCDTKDEYENILIQLEGLHIRWASGRKATNYSDVYWRIHHSIVGLTNTGDRIMIRVFDTEHTNIDYYYSELNTIKSLY